jgi:hypothetical protein
MKSMNGKLSVTVPGEAGTTKLIETRHFPDGVGVAKVGVGVGATLNTGNYSSIRCDVYVELPCLPEEVQETQAKARDIANTELKMFLDSAQKPRG